MKFDTFYRLYKFVYFPLVGLSVVFFLLNAGKLPWVNNLIPLGVMLFLGTFSFALYQIGAVIFADEEGIDIDSR